MYSLVVEYPIGRQVWWKPFKATGPQAVADVDGDGRFEIGGVTAGQLYNWPKFYAVDGPDKEFLCYDALTGVVKWTFPLGRRQRAWLRPTWTATGSRSSSSARRTGD